MTLRKMITTAGLALGLALTACASGTTTAGESSVGFDAKAMDCCKQTTECTAEKQAACEAAKKECSAEKKAACPKTGAKADG